jgi:ABC-2 type transport system ATP-binding protein
MTILIETNDLSKSFGDFQAVDGVTLQVEAGEVLALLGPNGAGKTTTIRMLASILRPTRGWATVAGHDVTQSQGQVRSSIGMLTEHHGLYTRMHAVEYLTFFGSIYQLPEIEIEQRIRELLSYLELDTLGKRVGEFSKGMRQKLALARAMLHDPPVLLLDEPTSAMDPASAKLVRESISSLRSSKRSIIICTHNLSEAEMLSDRIAIIQTGKIVALGTPDELKRQVLGAPIMHVELAHSPDGAKPIFPEGAQVLETGENWLRYQVEDPDTTNPLVLSSLAASGFSVVTLSGVRRSLEEVYLEVVNGGSIYMDGAEQ